MFWIIERWGKEPSKIADEWVEVIEGTQKIVSREAGMLIARKWKDIAGTIRVTLHHCRHDEIPYKPCIREEV